MTNRCLCLLIVTGWWLLGGIGWAQVPSPVVGRVLDGDTRKPVPFASVYVNASTRGTTADADGKYLLPGIPSGTVELVASAVGYETVRQLLQLGDLKNRRITFMLKPDAIGLKTVTVKAKHTAAYNRMLKQFKRELLGDNAAASQCDITNIGVVSLTSTEGHLLASATEPLLIDNQALGYRLIYQLFQFDFFQGATYYGGASRFEEMKATNSEQADRWERNRQRAYLGSGRHLLASLLAGTAEREGFLVFESDYDLSGKTAMPLARFNRYPPDRKVRADSLFSAAEVPSERYFYTAKPLEVFYTRQRAITPYRELPYAYSLVYLPRGPATVTTDGWVVHPNGMEMRGALSADRLATLLPADWQPNAQKTPVPVVVAQQGTLLPPDTRLDSLVARGQLIRKNAAPALYLHTDKDLYGSGESLWFGGLVLDPVTQLPVDQAVIEAEAPLHVDLLASNGRLVGHQWVRVTAGRVVGSLPLPDTLTTGTYRLRAYTDADKPNTRPAFERDLFIVGKQATGPQPDPVLSPAGSPPVDVQFLPEGGRWVAGLTTRLGIKAVDRRGLGVAVSGCIRSVGGAELGRFTTSALGMGSVVVQPATGEAYTAQVGWKGDSIRVSLPAVDTAGLVLTADLVSDSTRLGLQVAAVGPWATQPVYLTVQSRGQLVQQAKLQLQNGQARLVVPTAKLPAGVAQVTLYNAQGYPQAERLVFIPDRLLPVGAELVLNKPTYQPHEHEPVQLSFRVADGFGDQLAMLGTVAITDAQQLPDDSLGTDIRTHLLLTGELRGRVDRADDYLKQTNRAGRQALDNLLLTQGWRRIDWRAETVVSPLVRAMPKGMRVGGTAFDQKGQPLTQTNLLATFTSQTDLPFARTTRTDQQGHFRFDGLTLADTATLQLQALTDRFKRMKTPNVRLDVSSFSFASDTARPRLSDGLNPALKARLLWSDSVRAARSESAAGYRGKSPSLGTERPLSSLADRYGTTELTILFDEDARHLANVYELMKGNISGVTVKRRDSTGVVSGYTVALRGAEPDQPPVYLIDGVALPENETGTALMSFNPVNVARVEVLNKNGRVAGLAFHLQAVGSADLTLTDPAVPGLLLRGIQADRQFYVPRYTSPSDSISPVANRRDVLYWNPELTTEPTGYSTLTFPLPDQTRIVRIRLQGVTTYGRPVSINRLLNVR